MASEAWRDGGGGHLDVYEEDRDRRCVESCSERGLIGLGAAGQPVAVGARPAQPATVLLGDDLHAAGGRRSGQRAHEAGAAERGHGL